MLNSSISSSLGKFTSDNQKQNSRSIDFQSVNSSCMTSKELKSLKKFRSSINNYFRRMKSNTSIYLNIFHLNNLKSHFVDNKRMTHNFPKTKSSDYIMPDISNITNIKKIKNLKITINDDSNNKINKNNIIFSPFNQSNFSTTINSLHYYNQSRMLKSSLSYNNPYDNNTNYINNINNSINKTNNNTTINNNNIENFNIHKIKLKKEYLCDFLDKTRKITLYKYSLNILKKLMQLENEKIVNNLDQQSLNLNLLKKILYLFNNYIIALDEYFVFLKKEIKDGKKENTKLVENKKILSTEIFSLGHQVFKIKNRLKDYLSNKYFLLSVKNQTKNYENFSAKDKKEFDSDVFMLKKIEEQLDSIFTGKTEEKKEKEVNNNNQNKKNTDFSQPPPQKGIIYSLSDKKLCTRKIFRKHYFSQNSIGDSIQIKKIYRTPRQFMKDLNLISIGINNSLKEFNKIQIELLQDKKMLINLNEEFNQNVNLKNQFNIMQNKLKNKLNALVKYNKYLKTNKKNILSHYEKKLNKSDFLSSKIREIIHNIKNSGDVKLYNYLKNFNIDDIKYKDSYLFNNKLLMLKIIEHTIQFLTDCGNEYKKKEKERFAVIESAVNNLSRINNFRTKREKEKIKKKLDLLNIMKKSHNLLFLPNRKNLCVNCFSKEIHERQFNRNKKNEMKMSTIDYDIDINF